MSAFIVSDIRLYYLESMYQASVTDEEARKVTFANARSNVTFLMRADPNDDTVFNLLANGFSRHGSPVMNSNPLHGDVGGRSRRKPLVPQHLSQVAVQRQAIEEQDCKRRQEYWQSCAMTEDTLVPLPLRRAQLERLYQIEGASAPQIRQRQWADLVTQELEATHSSPRCVCGTPLVQAEGRCVYSC